MGINALIAELEEALHGGDLVLTVNPHEAEPEALLQREDTRKETVVAKKQKRHSNVITNIIRVLNEAILQISYAVKESVIKSRRHFKTKSCYK